MIYIFLIFCLFALLFNKNETILGCGLFGYVGNDPVDMMRIKLLGIYNLSRGKHSCGISYDYDIVKGTDGDKEWNKFIENVEFPNTIDNQVVIGHTRWATTGAHTYKNTHPFDINGHMVGAHNGTIENIDDLVTKYEVNVDGIEVDSHKLLKIIDEKGYAVLGEYLGYAALMFRYYEEPNVLYVYHGCSQEDNHKPYYVERPLHYINIGKGAYISSMPESLEAIMNDKFLDNEAKDEIKVLEIPVNKLLRIDYTESKPKTSVIADVDRYTVNLGLKPYKDSKLRPIVYEYPARNNQRYNQTPAKVTAYFTPEDVKLGMVHHVNYHNAVYSVLAKPLNGTFFITNDGKARHADSIKGSAEANKPRVYNFYRGIMIKNHESYNQLWRNNAAINKTVGNSLKFAKFISRYSMYPVSAYVDGKTTWFWNGGKHKYLSFAPYFNWNCFEIYGCSELYSYVNDDYTINNINDAETVCTSYEARFKVDVDATAYDDMYLIDNHYKTQSEIVQSISEEVLMMIFDYVTNVHVSKNPALTKQELEDKCYVLFDTVIKENKTIREVFEVEGMTFEEYAAIAKEAEKESEEKEDDEDSSEVEIIEVSLEDLMADARQMELPDAINSEETLKYEEYLDNLEDMVCNIKGALDVFHILKKSTDLEVVGLCNSMEKSLADTAELLGQHLTDNRHDKMLISLVKSFKPMLVE